MDNNRSHSYVGTIQANIRTIQNALQSMEKSLSVLRQRADKLFSSSNSPTDVAEYYRIVDHIHRLKRKIQKKQHELAFLQQQLPKESTAPSDHSRKSQDFSSSDISHAPSVSHIQYPSITVGDYCCHKSYGKGIVYFQDHKTFRVFFSNKSIRTFSCHDSDFADKTLIIENSWNRTKGKYTQPFPYSSSIIPQSLQSSYETFIRNQNIDLCHSISQLRLHPQSASSFYAQHALDNIYNIEHGEEVFLFLQKSGITLPQRKPAEPVIKFIPPESPKPVPPKIPSPPQSQKIQYKPASDTLYVYSGRIKCIRNKHTMTCVNALIDTASGEVAKFNVNCCLNCNRFYISYDEYARYMEKYKSLLTRIVLVDQNGNSSFNNTLAAESTLKLCGYSVSQEKGFTSEERHNLLSKIIHAGVISKPDVIQLLNWFIKMNGQRTGNSIAKEKWEEDLSFVRCLDMNSQTNQKIHSVVPYPRKKGKKRY